MKSEGKEAGPASPINFVQSELKEILGSFVNGGFSASGYVLYPLVKEVSPFLAERLGNLFYFIKKNEKYIDFSSSLKKYEGISGNANSPKNFAKLLSELYMDFDSNKPIDKKSKIAVNPYALDDNDYTTDYLKPVLKFKQFSERKLKGYIAGAYVHGSLATLDYVKGWSDFDTLVIIRRDAIADYKKLLELRDLFYMSRSFLCEIDPLQHHGHMIFTEYDMDYYCQAFFPLVLFKYSKSLLGPKKLEFKLRDCTNENIAKFRWFADYFKNLNGNSKMSSYNAKFLLHAVTLFPTLYLQAKNIHVYKKFSFGIARKDFKPKEWEVVDYVSSLRMNWKNRANFGLAASYSGINPVLAYQLNARLRDLNSSIIKLNNIDVRKIADGMKVLAGSAGSKIN